MNYDPDAGLDVPSRTWQEQASERVDVLNGLGLDTRPATEFDQFAARLADAFHQLHGSDLDGIGLYAMVNLFGRHEQTFVGLHNPHGHPPVDRTMKPDHGFCPDLLDRSGALILADVCATPQFASNPVVDGLGVRNYAGAPLIHEQRGIAVGSVCVVGTMRALPNETRRSSLALIKRHRDQLAAMLNDRARTRTGTGGGLGGGRHSSGYQSG